MEMLRIYTVRDRATQDEFLLVTIGAVCVYIALRRLEHSLPIPSALLNILLIAFVVIPQVTVRIRRWRDLGLGWPYILLDVIFFPIMTLVHLLAPSFPAGPVPAHQPAGRSFQFDPTWLTPERTQLLRTLGAAGVKFLIANNGGDHTFDRLRIWVPYHLPASGIERSLRKLLGRGVYVMESYIGWCKYYLA